MKHHMVAMKAFITVFASLWLLLGVTGASGELVDRIVAIVNNDAITLSELNEAIKPYAQQIRASRYTPGQGHKMLLQLRQDILNSMIDQKLTDQQSKNLGVQVQDIDVEQRIEQIKREHFLTEEELRKTLAAEDYTMEEYRQHLKEQMLRIKLINMEVKSKIAITEKEIRDYYEKHKEKYQEQKKYHLRTILIRISSSKASENAEALKKAEAIVRKLEAGTPFEMLAEQYSEDATAKDGGDLGLFSLEELSPKFQEAVRNMKAGEFSPVLETPLGYQILMLQQVKTFPAKTLKEARIEIQESLYKDLVEEKYKAWLTALRERSYIKIIQ